MAGRLFDREPAPGGDSHDQLHILATDTGTWPCEGGGVSCCRRDMVNNLDSIKWHIVAEAANDYSIPRFQIERNVQSLKILPLWGLDLLTPTHGIIEDQLDSAIHEHLTKPSTGARLASGAVSRPQRLVSRRVVRRHRRG